MKKTPTPPSADLRDDVIEAIAWGRQLNKTAGEVSDDIMQLVSRHNLRLWRQIEGIVEVQIEASEKNLAYQKNKTKNKALARDWKNILFGERLIQNSLDKLKRNVLNGG